MSHYIIYFSFFILGAFFSGIIIMLLFFKLKNVFNTDFAQIANDVIKKEQEDLRKQNREAIEEKLLPLSRELLEFKNNVQKLNISGVENTTKIIEQLSVLEKNNQSIQQEAKNLTEALTKNQNIKGAYGEGIIDMILQNSGMQEGIHYTKQYVTYSENSKDDSIHKIRPDIVINLPNNRHLIIDSKVTLTSYLEYIQDNTKLNKFKTEVKSRINDLAKKNYHLADDVVQPDFILMYMPIEASVSLLYEDNDIINLAYNSNIIIVDTASLLVAIRLVNELFAQQSQNENIKKIVNAGTNLYETFVLLCNELISLEKEINDISHQFRTTINRFQRANKNRPSLFSQVNELKSLGINTSKQIPAKFLEQSIEDTNNEVLING